MKVAVEGCCHGCLDEIYETISYVEKSENIKIEILIICGDFQATRTLEDLACMACPDKYKQMGTFYKYYNGMDLMMKEMDLRIFEGDKIAPLLTIFIGGNHEASNYLQELFYGGWVAPNIYYLGSAGVVKYKNLRIAGISGIYNKHHYMTPNYERPPYTSSTMRSVYHVRDLQVLQMKLLKQTSISKKEDLDIFLSHDWPRNIVSYGNKADLLQKKPYLRREVQENTLGNPGSEVLLHSLQPRYWFSAHMHVKFSGVVQHAETKRITKFLALDKCLPGRDFLQIIEFNDVDLGYCSKLQYDESWLAILHATHNLEGKQSPLTPPTESAINKALDEIRHRFNGNYEIPDSSFKQTVIDTHTEKYSAKRHNLPRRPEHMGNPQTDLFLAKLGLSHSGITIPYGQTFEPAGVKAAAKVVADANEIDLDAL